MPDKITYEFTSKGLKNNEKLVVTDFRGSEAISKPYEYTISLKSESADIDMDEMLSAPCTFLMTVGKYQRPVHGCLSDFEQLHQADQFTLYRAVLVPRLWQLTLYKANEVYLKDLNDKDGTTVPDIIETVLKECGFSTLDYKMQLNASYPRRPYRCQWSETHFQYISRLMEHEGICYYFEQDKASEKIVFCDNLNSHKDMRDPDVNYAPVSGVDIHTAGSNLRSLVCRKKRMPKTVVLQDYNYEKPSLDVTGTAVVDEKGVGEVFVYGDNFETPEEGKWLAKIRAEEMFCTKERFHGEGMVSRMTPGYLFDLKGHFRQSFNQKYLITEIEHEGVAPSFLTERRGEGEDASPAYANSFTAIPASVQFRPERVTPKSRFHGMINAVVDGRAGSDPYADLDEIGRYKTILPFDRETRDQPGNASWWFRKAEPHAGKDEGMHFPLRRDTEVLLSFIDGDPDRPVISSAIANPGTPNVVATENRSKNILRTRSGNLLEMEDNHSGERIKLATPMANTYMHLGKANAKGDGLVTLTTGLRRMEHLGGEQKTTMTTGARTQDVKDYIKDKNSKDNEGFTEKKDDHHDIFHETSTQAGGFVFPKRNYDLNYASVSARVADEGKASGGYLSDSDETTGEFIINRQFGPRYYYGGGPEFNYGTGNIFSFGNAQEVTHWKTEDDCEAQKMAKTMYDYNLTGIQAYDGCPQDTSWEKIVSQGQVELVFSDSFAAQNGNIYDFGGHWDYSLGNGYEETYMAQNNVKINQLGKKDLADKGGPAWTKINAKSLEGIPSGPGGNVWISKTFGKAGSGDGATERGYSYEYSEYVDSVEVEYHQKAESHVYGKQEWEYTYRGDDTKKTYTMSGGSGEIRSEEKRYNPDEIEIYHQKVEDNCDTHEWKKWTGGVASYNFTKYPGWFNFEAKLAYMPIINVAFSFSTNETSLSVSVGTTIDISAKAAATIDISASAALEFGLSANASLGLKIKGSAGGDHTYDYVSGEWESELPFTKVYKAAKLKADKKDMVLESLTALICAETFVMKNHSMDFNKSDVKTTMAMIFNL